MSETNGQLASRESFWLAEQTRFKIVDVPHFGKVRLKSITEAERCRIDAAPIEHRFAWYCLSMIVDEDGDAMFAEMDIERLSNLDNGATEPLYQQMVFHAVPGGKIPTVEEAKKNLKKTADSGSTST